MNGPKYRTYTAEPGVTAHDLMNDATEWLQYSRGLTHLLSELLHDADGVKGEDIAIALDAIEVLTHMGLQSATQAHTRMLWDQTPPVSDLLTRT
jgi:hypothetical protein